MSLDAGSCQLSFESEWDHVTACRWRCERGFSLEPWDDKISTHCTLSVLYSFTVQLSGNLYQACYIPSLWLVFARPLKQKLNDCCIFIHIHLYLTQHAAIVLSATGNRWCHLVEHLRWIKAERLI